MEVHSHSHTPRKKCLPAGKAGTHYFWEFLMLFLAVFCMVGRGVASIRYSNNGFQPVASWKKKTESRRLDTFVRICVVPMALSSYPSSFSPD